MVRRRKNEAKAAAKPPPKTLAVRKSTRQKKKKQSDEQKTNGDLLLSDVNNSDDSKDTNDQSSQEPVKTYNTVPKKSARFKQSMAEQENAEHGESVHSIAVESDSQDGSNDNVVSEKVDSVEELVCDWNEEVIEETIICEEMEVDEQVSSTTSLNPENKLLEQVVIVQNSDSMDQSIEYTLVECEAKEPNVENVANASLVSNTSFSNSDSCNKIEQALSVLHMNEQNSLEESKSVLSVTNSVNDTSVNKIENSVKVAKDAVVQKDNQTLKSTAKSPKEAQKCFCESTNCRGWIGDNPDDNKKKSDLLDEFDDDSDEEEVEEEEQEEEEEEEEKEKDEKVKVEPQQESINKEVLIKPPKKRGRRKRQPRKVSEHMEDEDLEEQIDRLCACGLKNQAHTLTLSRLMVRSREILHRTRLLKVIQKGEQPCRRLFLDYHGLRLMWSYMMDVAGNISEEANEFRLEILRTLGTLPIPNKSMLIDSKVLAVIEKWSKQLNCIPPSADSPGDDEASTKSGASSNQGATPMEVDKEEPIVSSTVAELASDLLLQWSSLKEVFRIPKKERIEQMREHERDADRAYKEDEDKNKTVVDKLQQQRLSQTPVDYGIGRKDKRIVEERSRDIVQVPRMSKFERRQLFALKVAKEEEERQRRQQEDSWAQHQAYCIGLGLDPNTTTAFDPQTGMPLYYDPQTGQWQAIQPPPPYTLPNGTPNVPPPAAYVQPETIVQPEPEPEPPAPQPEPQIELPPRWAWSRDARGRVYYYHKKERISQWLPPPPDHLYREQDSSASSSESSDSENDSSSMEETEEDPPVPTPLETSSITEPLSTEIEAMDTLPVVTVATATKKRRDGLVQERIISLQNHQI
ncbi:unnamed protein product [Trichogramma brassicae]|uniref:WW domain-containing protein n=1 Tax=Trichogramma brassicae TaxID=86971 RepID=A0A6H5HW02_9HYME|nr:unnamed protein product [Trichogramma brassicae]